MVSILKFMVASFNTPTSFDAIKNNLLQSISTTTATTDTKTMSKILKVF